LTIQRKAVIVAADNPAAGRMEEPMPSLPRIVAVLLLVAAPSTALGQAGGLLLYELGDPASGASSAGQSAIARDASTAYLNPAGMTRLEGSEFLAGIQPMRIVFEFDPDEGTTTTGGDGGDAGSWVPAGGLFLSHQLNDRVAIGLSSVGIMGASYDYGRNWVGRYFAIEGEITILNFEPSVAFRVNDWLSVGAGVDIQYATLEQEVAVNRPAMLPDGRVELDQDSWDVGFSVGVLAELSERTRIGFRYRSEVEHDLEGDLDVAAGFTASADLKLPVPAGANISDWSAFDYSVINVETNPPVQGTIPRRWNDTWRVGLGAHFRPSDRWLVQFGGSYDSSPVDSEDRTPDAPIDEQWRLSFGVEHEVSDSFRLGGYYTFMYMPNVGINNQLGPLSGTLSGEYDRAEIHIIGLYAAWSF
jgi:long-chain fatty acid transport protein